MKILTEISDIRCDHGSGRVQNEPKQSLVFINGSKVMVRPATWSLSIKGCPIVNSPAGKKCTGTLPWPTPLAGHSALIFINDEPVVLDTVVGITDGVGTGTSQYRCLSARQSFVESNQ